MLAYNFLLAHNFAHITRLPHNLRRGGLPTIALLNHWATSFFTFGGVLHRTRYWLWAYLHFNDI